MKRTYGSTEAPTIITDGQPIGPVELRLDRDGELQVRGRKCAWATSTPRNRNKSFTEDGWFRTGDLATIDAPGPWRSPDERRT